LWINAQPGGPCAAATGVPCRCGVQIVQSPQQPVHEVARPVAVVVGAQWPIQPGFPAFAGGAKSAPESILFKAPGRVVPVYVVNTTMESYFQKGNQVAGPLEEDDRLPPGFFADQPAGPVTPDRTLVFGTESCVGCHYSAGAAVAFTRDENGKLMRDPATVLKIPVYGERGNFGQNGNSDYF
jgi:hypothetical protein